METTLPEHLAHALWPKRPQFRFLQTKEFNTELTLLDAVRSDLSKRFYHDLPTAVSFYKDLNQHGVE